MPLEKLEYSCAVVELFFASRLKALLPKRKPGPIAPEL